jgi:hypothetical protein
MKLAYQFANELIKKYPNSWDANGRAGEQWVTDFTKNNSVVSVRKPQATSVTTFNSLVEELFTKYSDFRKIQALS